MAKAILWPTDRPKKMKAAEPMRAPTRNSGDMTHLYFQERYMSPSIVSMRHGDALGEQVSSDRARLVLQRPSTKDGVVDHQDDDGAND